MNDNISSSEPFLPTNKCKATTHKTLKAYRVFKMTAIQHINTGNEYKVNKIIYACIIILLFVQSGQS